MGNDNRRYVVPNEGGGWDVKAPDAKSASAHGDTQQQAQHRAREMAQNAGGGEAVTDGRDGQVRDSDTISPGSDPNSPRDKR